MYTISRIIKITFTLLLVVIGLAACNSKIKNFEPVKFTGEAQGTYYAITYFDDQSRDFQSSIDSLFKSFDLSASIYKKESIISRFNNNDPTVSADKTFEIIFKKAMEVSKITDGAFDITVMPLVNAWGFGFKERSKVDSARVDSLLPLVGYNKIKLVNGRLVKDNPDMMIDYNAIAQGYTTDLIGTFLEQKDIHSYLVDVGGEVLAKGTKPDGSSWNVGIEKPAGSADDAREVQIVIPLDNKALATSGNYRKFFIEGGQKYSHTIDPKTGFPVHHSVLSVSVVANDCMTADAYATAFMVMGLEKSKQFLSGVDTLEAFIIYDDNGSTKTWSSNEIFNQGNNQ